MQENSQWQAFAETGDIRHYLRFKQAQLVAEEVPQKEFSDGRICDLSTGSTRSEI